jgi:hypothetical protein
LYNIIVLPYTLYGCELSRDLSQWDLQTTSYPICDKNFTNIYGHVWSTCSGRVAIRGAWWNTVIDLAIALSAELCSLCDQDLYFFLLGARICLQAILSHYDIDEAGLHHLNFRFLRDAASWYSTKLRLIWQKSFPVPGV